MKFYLFFLIALSKNCLCLDTNFTTEGNSSLLHSNESLKPPNGLLNDQINNIPPDVISENENRLSNHMNGSSKEYNTSTSAINAFDQSDINEEGVINKGNDSDNAAPPEPLVEDAVENLIAAQWVAALIFGAILVYIVMFIIAVTMLECKGQGRRTMDDEKLGSSSVEKQRLLDGASVSENTQDYYPEDDFENCNQSNTNAVLSLESPAVRTCNQSQLPKNRSDLHHLLGSSVAEVEVFPHGSLQRPPKKGCLHFQNDIIS